MVTFAYRAFHKMRMAESTIERVFDLNPVARLSMWANAQTLANSATFVVHAGECYKRWLNPPTHFHASADRNKAGAILELLS
jgi:hypothetical protein